MIVPFAPEVTYTAWSFLCSGTLDPKGVRGLKMVATEVFIVSINTILHRSYVVRRRFGHSSSKQCSQLLLVSSCLISASTTLCA